MTILAFAGTIVVLFIFGYIFCTVWSLIDQGKEYETGPGCLILLVIAIVLALLVAGGLEG